jgi:hypothetical protein
LQVPRRQFVQRHHARERARLIAYDRQGRPVAAEEVDRVGDLGVLRQFRNRSGEGARGAGAALGAGDQSVTGVEGAEDEIALANQHAGAVGGRAQDGVEVDGADHRGDLRGRDPQIGDRISGSVSERVSNS